MSEFDVTPEFDKEEPVEIEVIPPDTDSQAALRGAILEEFPPEPPVAESAPFIIERNKFGPGAHGVYWPDGTPVGVWMRDSNLTPEAVGEILLAKGMPEDLVQGFVRQRQGGIEADKQLSQEPAVIANQARLDEHNAITEHLRAAFLEAKSKEKT